MSDLVTKRAAFEYLDLEPDGDDLDRQVQTFVTGASLAIEDQRGPILARSIGAVDAGTTPDLALAASVTGAQVARLVDRKGCRLSVGTDADPWATLPLARLIDVDATAGRVRLDCGGVTVPADSALFIGRHLADDLPESVKMACLITVRNRWQFEKATASQTYDNPAGGTPWMIPTAALDLLSDYPPGGMA